MSYSSFSKPIGRSAGLPTQCKFQSPLSETAKGERSRGVVSADLASGNGYDVARGGSLLRPTTSGFSQSGTSLSSTNDNIHSMFIEVRSLSAAQNTIHQ